MSDTSQVSLPSSKIKHAQQFHSHSVLEESFHQSHHKTPPPAKAMHAHTQKSANDRRSVPDRGFKHGLVIYDATLEGIFMELGVALM